MRVSVGVWVGVSVGVAVAVSVAVAVGVSVGVGRSVCVASAVLIRMGYSLPQAYEAVRRKRPQAVISERQVKALRRYADSLSSRPAP